MRRLSMSHFAQSGCDARRGYAATAFASAGVFMVTLRYILLGSLISLLAFNYHSKSQLHVRRKGKLKSSGSEAETSTERTQSCS